MDREKDEIRSRQQALLEMRDALSDRLRKLQLHTHHRSEPLSADSKDQAVELQGQETYHSLEESTGNQLKEVQHALDRIKLGAGENCETCGVEISADRLKAIAYATLCTVCAGRATNH